MKGYAPIVRPWLKAGLNVLLMEDEARVLALRAKPEGTAQECQPQPVKPVAQAAPVVPSAVPPRFASPRKAPACAPRPEAVASAASVEQKKAPASPVAPRVAQPAQARGGQSLLAAPGALPVDRWPAPWLALKDRRPLPQRPLVLWSYAGLGEDLAGAPDEARKRVIVRMLTELKHPVGTHVFWPFALAGEAPSAEASLFWSGVSLLDPRVLLLFGSDTRDALNMPKTLLPFCQARVHGRLVIQLPRPQALAADESAFRQAQAFLARILSFCAKR